MPALSLSLSPCPKRVPFGCHLAVTAPPCPCVAHVQPSSARCVPLQPRDSGVQVPGLCSHPCLCSHPHPIPHPCPCSIPVLIPILTHVPIPILVPISVPIPIPVPIAILFPIPVPIPIPVPTPSPSHPSTGSPCEMWLVVVSPLSVPTCLQDAGGDGSPVSPVGTHSPGSSDPRRIPFSMHAAAPIMLIAPNHAFTLENSLVALMGPQERGNKAMNHTLPFLSQRPNIPSPPHTPEPHLTRGSASTVVPPFPSCCQLCTHWRTEQHGDVPTAQGQPQALSSFMAPWRNLPPLTHRASLKLPLYSGAGDGC